LLIIVLMFSVVSQVKTTQDNSILEDILKISMPRPIKEMIIGFTLEGRNVVREVDGNALSNTLLGKAIKSKSPGSTKAMVDKVPKAKAAKAAAQARALLNEKRRKAFQTRVIEQADRYRAELRAQQDAEAANDSMPNENEYVPRKQNKSSAQGDSSPNEKKEVKTSAEWKSLILSQPTEANLGAMIKALPAGEIDLDTYLEISESLIKNNSQEKRRMGIWALTSTYRQEAFKLASHLVGEMEAANQKLLNDYMYSYNRNQTLGILDLVLKSNDTIAATAAAQSISKAIQNIQSTSATNQTTSRGNVTRTGGTVKQLTINSYHRLIPTLKFVISKNLNSLSQWAQTLLSQLQTINTTA
jgi:hypothetical protein